MSKKIITLSGFGTFDGNEEALQDMKAIAKRYGIEFCTTYYDHELRGSADDIERVTLGLWGMKRDDWADNGLTEQEA